MQKRKTASNRPTASGRPSPSPGPERKGSGKEKEDKDNRHRIRLRFRDWAARMVSERRWHPSQQLNWIDEGNDLLEIALELAGFEEVRRWILSWGPQVEVLEPPELRQEIAESLKGTLARYVEG